MGLFKDLVELGAKHGPETIQKLLVLSERMPKDDTIRTVCGTAEKFIPYLATLEKVVGNGNLENLQRLIDKIPDTHTLNRLIEYLPMLEKMPDKEMLGKLLAKADSFESLLESIDKS